MPIKRGKRKRSYVEATARNLQCPRCFVMLTGRHHNKNPRRKVNYQDDKGVYASPEEFAAAGGEPERVTAYGGSIKDPEYEDEHAVGHYHCPTCAAAWEVEYTRELDELREQMDARRAAREQAAREAEGGTEGGDGA